jgi:hypothetical protein
MKDTNSNLCGFCGKHRIYYTHDMEGHNGPGTAGCSPNANCGHHAFVNQTEAAEGEVPTYWARIYMSGPIDVAKHTIREECLREGLCVTVEPMTYIYTGGEEAGFVVGLINYPRFPSTPEAITERARGLLQKLLESTFQRSALLMTPEKTERHER